MAAVKSFIICHPNPRCNPDTSQPQPILLPLVVPAPWTSPIYDLPLKHGWLPLPHSEALSWVFCHNPRLLFLSSRILARFTSIVQFFLSQNGIVAGPSQTVPLKVTMFKMQLLEEMVVLSKLAPSLENLVNPGTSMLVTLFGFPN